MENKVMNNIHILYKYDSSGGGHGEGSITTWVVFHPQVFTKEKSAMNKMKELNTNEPYSHWKIQSFYTIIN